MSKTTMSAADVRVFRWKLGLKPNELGVLLGVTGPAVEHWESGRRKVPEYAVKLIQAFKRYPDLMGTDLTKDREL